MIICGLKCVLLFAQIVLALWGTKGRDGWLKSFYGFSLAEAILQLLIMATVAITLDLSLTDNLSTFQPGGEKATQEMSFYRACWWMNTHLVAVYSAYWFIEAIGGLRFKICNEYASAIGKTFLVFALGMVAGAVNLFHATEYWVNHA